MAQPLISGTACASTWTDNIYVIVEFLHVKPAKVRFVRTTKKKCNRAAFWIKHSTRVKVDEVRIETSLFQYLYRDDMGYNFMNTRTFDRFHPGEQIEGVQFLKREMWWKYRFMPKVVPS